MNALTPREAYRLWAPVYAAETVISFLDEELAAAMSPPLAGKRLLDAGCGTGRRLAHGVATLSVGIDASFEMLAAGNAQAVAAADVRALPFAANEFDLIWCRLVLGHLANLVPAYRELTRVCRPGGHLFVTDFHVEAVAAGHKRTFRDADGVVREVEHHVHDNAAHIAVAAISGLSIVDQRDAIIGPSAEPFYERAGRSAAYNGDKGLAVVAAFLFRLAN